MNPTMIPSLTLKERAEEALRGIFDPEIPVNIYDLGLIYTLEIDEENHYIAVEMTLTSPNCPVAESFPQTVQDKLLALEGVHSVKVALVFEPPWTKDRMSEVAKLQLDMF
jgi:FeS assembly SUF system protein